MTGTENDYDAKHYFHQSRNNFSAAGMNLQCWKSNSMVLQDEIGEADGDTRLLGIIWKREVDMLKIPIQKLVQDLKSLKFLTKRKKNS